MTRLNELKQQRIEAAKAHRAQLDKHLEACKAEDRGFSDEEKAAHAAAEAKIAGLDEMITAEERRIDLEKVQAARTPSPAVTVEKPNFEEDPRWGFKSHRDFLLAVIENSGLRDRSLVDDERLRAVAVFDKEDKSAAGELAFMLPRGYTPRSLMAAAGSDEQGEYDDRYGGFLVQTTRLPGLMGTMWEGDPTVGRTQTVPMASPSVEIIARNDKDHSSSVSGGFTVARRPETASISSARASLEKITLKASSLFGLAYETEELLQDSPISFAAIIETGFRTQFAAHMIKEKLRGLGGTEYLGVLTALAASSLGPTLKVAKETGQAADTIAGENVIKMAARCWGFDNAIWMANHDCKPQLYKLNVPVGVAGQLLFQPAREVGFPDMLLGRPVYYSEHMSTIGDAGDIGLFAWSEFLEGLYQPLQFAESVHVRFLNHEHTFKSWLRNAGAPWWRVAMTPEQSTSTLSPFVILAAR